MNYKKKLEIAVAVKDICEKHDINYFIDFGTLLGAVRHKGFIPWDDDFDFGMLRSDYDRFLKIAQKELPSNLFLQTIETDEYYGLPYAKIRMNNTLFIESIAQDSLAHAGIYVELYNL